MAGPVIDVGGVPISLDANSLDINEGLEFEEFLGVPFDQCVALIAGTNLKAIRYLFFILGKRSNPAFTLEDAGKVKFVDLFEKAKEGESAEPAKAPEATPFALESALP